MRGGRLVLEDCILDRNEAVSKGGAVDLQSAAELTATGTTWSRNDAVIGEALHAGPDTTVTDQGSTISLNDADEDGGGIATDGALAAAFTGSSWSANEADRGGAIFVADAYTPVVFTDATVADNDARTSDGGGAWFGTGTTLELDGGSWIRNRANVGRGGGVATDGATLRLELGDALDPCLVRMPDRDDCTFVVMPMRLD